MPSAPCSSASSKAAMVFSGASAEAPRWPITRGRASAPGTVGLRRGVALSGRAHARDRRRPAGHPARSAHLLPHPLRRRPSHPSLRSSPHRAEPCHVCRPGARDHSGAPARPLHGMERPVPRAWPLVAHPPPARLSGGHRRGRRGRDPGRGPPPPRGGGGHDLPRGRPEPRRAGPALPPRRVPPGLLARRARHAGDHHRGARVLAARSPPAAPRPPHHRLSSGDRAAGGRRT